jgi:tripartite-type tricarboxylate transporter receptor subunit TctC
MMKHKLLAIILSLLCTMAHAQRNINLVVPFTFGGTADRVALIILPFLKLELAKHNLTPVITYISGGGGLIGAAAVAKSDRPQLLLAPNTLLTASLINSAAASFSVTEDIVILQYIGHVPMLLVVNKNSPWASINDLQKDCQRRPVVYGSAGIGTLTHVSSAMIMQHLGCKTVHVPYKGSGQAHIDLSGNHIEFTTDFVTSIKPHIDAGTFRPLLAVDKNRNRDYPTVHSLGDIDFKEYDLYNWFTLAASANLPAEEIIKLKQILHKVFQNPSLRHQLQLAGYKGIDQPIPPNFLNVELQKMKQILGKISIDAK